MRGIIRYSALLAAVALLFPKFGFAEQPPGMVAPAVGAPNTVAWTFRAPDIPRMPTSPRAMIPKTGPRGEAPGDLIVERPGSSEIKKDGGADIKALVDEGAFLLPTWNRGFWVMPPGGLTRFLMPPRGFINPEQTLPSDPVIVSSG